MNGRRSLASPTQAAGMLIRRVKARLLRDIGPSEGVTEGGVELNPRLYPSFGPAEIWELDPDYSQSVDCQISDVWPITTHGTGANSTLTIDSEDPTIFLKYDPLLIFGTNGDALAPAVVAFKGPWNADTNVPALVSGVGTTGDLYIVSESGTTPLDGVSDWPQGTWLVFDAGAWQIRSAPDGINDRRGLCISDASIVAGVLTINTNLNLSAADENGFVIRLVPQPHRVGRVVQAVNRWTDATLLEGMIVSLEQEAGSEWWDIQASGCGSFEDDGLNFRGE